ncbi:MAG: metalloprotease family protein, partial [Salinibacter sp.]
WSGLAPYAHCAAPLHCGAYRWAIALPGLVLGPPPLAAGLITGHWLTTLFAFIMLAAAGGDALLLWTLRGIPGNAWVQDHPCKMGALVLGHGSSGAAPRLAFDPEAGAQESEDSGTKTTRWLLVILIVSAVIGGVAGFMAASM